MRLNELFLAELERESARSRRVLEQVPDNKGDWKPHDRSMAFGYLANLVATMPTWLAMGVERDELDLKPAGGSGMTMEPMNKAAEYVSALDRAVAEARAALAGATDAHLVTPWRLLVAGKTVWETPRHEMMRDTINHWAHHRGQMTVYLRLLGAKVPSVYGPSADDQSF